MAPQFIVVGVLFVVRFAVLFTALLAVLWAMPFAVQFAVPITVLLVGWDCSSTSWTCPDAWSIWTFQVGGYNPGSGS